MRASVGWVFLSFLTACKPAEDGAAGTMRTERAPNRVQVPSAEYPSIQRGVDAVADGGTVVVADGTYAETITITGKEVHVQGSGSTGIRATVLVQPRATEIPPASLSTGVITFGPGGSGSVTSLAIDGGDAGVLVANDDSRTSAAAPVSLDDLSIAGAVRGVLSTSSAPLEVQGSEIRETSWHGIVVSPDTLLPESVKVFDNTVVEVGGVGVYLKNVGGTCAEEGPHNIEGGSYLGNAEGGIFAVGSGVCIANVIAGANTRFNIGLVDSISLITDSYVLDAIPTADDIWGAGIVMVRSEASVIGTDIELNHHAGIALYTGFGWLEELTIYCNAFDLNVEAFDENSPQGVFDGDINTLACGKCGETPAVGECAVVSAGLGPPGALDSID